MKSKILAIKTLFLFSLVLSLSLGLGGCSDDDEALQVEYGYAQFKLFKSASYKKLASTGSNELDYLGQAEKMKIVMTNNQDGSELIQTVGLNQLGDDAEQGLRSEKLKLMAGSYTVVGFYLYQIEGQELTLVLSGEPEEPTVIDVVGGGLCVKDLPVKVVSRGKLQFSLKKNFVADTKSADNADRYRFDEVAYATLYVQNEFTMAEEVFEMVPFEYAEKLSEDGVLYAVATSDSIFTVRAGSYSVVSYVLYDKSKKMVDGDRVLLDGSFQIADNQQTSVDVAVNLYPSAAYIQDYIALRRIWEALDGENWSYDDIGYSKGTNWDFNKDIDLWGQQPGVSIDSRGRIVNLNLGSFGPKGRVPDEIGQLTELKILTLGTHSDRVGGNMPEQWDEAGTAAQKQAWRDDYYNRFIKKDVRASFSEPLQLAFDLKAEEDGKAGLASASPLISRKDVQPGVFTNGITGISSEISKLTKLQQLFIANGKFADFEEGTDFSQMEDLTDVEFYNCPLMEALPEALFTMPNVELLNLATNPQIEAAVLEQGLDQLAQSATASKLQILYLGNNRLTTLPESFRNFKKLGKLDCNNNQIRTIPAFGKDVNLVQLTMDYNQITEIPNIDGYFCGYDDVETFSFAHNKLTVFPNIFDAKSVYGMSTVDFSYNQIAEFEGGDDFRGIHVGTLSLAGNQLKTFPAIFFQTNSIIGALGLSGNGMESFPDGSLKGEYTYFLESLDLSYNKLTELPVEFLASTLPYLYGLDLSNNRFSSFPYGPLNISRLTVYALRNQRDENGNRTLREWPVGISTCPSLRAFYMGGNDLRKIDDTISPSIYIFEIKDNPNISIDMSDVCAYIGAGYYILVYDRTQDIRGCDYLDLD
ncbi:DUF4458 domain-containing protein [Mangrovibacterium marinum]|uniref:Leucine rich repeat (LRR) protein n=1 Tax=Mangrovibacterium marinum TaxID=1639118 RepID=A0A2T5C643_9BACT|nr:DUF4458 domain-containing protein [Mangrovibacterium marinum]PTN10418.1 leucine rich repeat (LRR) protein [Mangrovibacterium marinum]